MNSPLVPIPAGAAPGLDPRWQELHARGEDFGTAAPRLARLDEVELRSGPLFRDPRFIEGLRSRHRHLGADRTSLASIDALGNGAACVITGQQPHLMVGPFYTAWKILGTIALARRLAELRGRPVVPVYWCGSDDSDFDEVSSAWLFDPARGPWRLQIPAAEWNPGMPVGDAARGKLARLEEAALSGLHGPGIEWFRERMADVVDTGLADRASAWILRMFHGSGLVVVDARDEALAAAARPLLERYAGLREDIAAAVAARADERAAEGWPVALDGAARESGIFALRDGVRVKLTGEEIDSGDALRWSWSPSVLLRPVVQDSLLAPVAAVLGPGELAYHAELKPVYEALGVAAARPVPRPHLILTGARWGLPDSPDALRRLLAGGSAARAELSRLELDDAARAAFEKLSTDVDKALKSAEVQLGHRVAARVRVRFDREIRRLQNAEADRGGGSVVRRVEWLARGKVPQERIYSCWLLRAWCDDPAGDVLDPLARAWVDAVDRAGSVQWVLPLEAIR